MPPNPYSSGNPVVDSLFSREFANYQVDDRARQVAAANEIARQQIMAQSELARAQQRSNDQQQLFRMQQSADNNRLASRQLDIDEEYKKGILSRQPVGTQVDAERRKAAIIDANSNAVNDAARANALLKIALDAELARAKEHDVGWFGGALGGTKASQFDDLNDPLRKALNKRVFDSVWAKLVSEKSGTAQSVIPDPDTFSFRPVQFDETGKAIALPLPTPGAGAGAAAGLGTTPAAAPGAANPAALGPMAPETEAIAGLVQPVVNKMFTSAADMFKMSAPAGSAASAAAAPVMQPVRIPVDQANDLEISAVDAAEAERQLRSVPPDQVPAVAAAIRDSLVKSGRARIVVRLPSMNEVLRNTPFN